MCISSRYTNTCQLIMSLMKSLIRALDTAGALVKPKGITHYSECPVEVLNAVFHWLPSRIRTKW